MRELIFWDTWAFAALVDTRYRYHEQANEINKQLKKKNAFMVTTEAVLTEVGNTFSKARLHDFAIEQIEFANRAARSGNARIANITTDLWLRAFDLYRQRPDKDWGHTDCISFIMMRELDLEKAFTADQHFEQAGFTRLVKPA